MSRRATCALVAVAVLATACSGGRGGSDAGGRIDELEPVSLDPGVLVAETRTRIGDDGGIARVGDASLTVPAGSLPSGAVVLAQLFSGPEVTDEYDPTVASIGLVRFVANDEVIGPLTVRIPVRDGVSRARVLSAEEGSILWSDESTRVVDGFAVAEVDHLSWFTAILPEVSNLSYTLFRLLGTRADFPDCPDGPPPWVLDIISPADEYRRAGLLPNAPLLPCGDRTREAEAGSEDGDLALRVAANRPYSVVVLATREVTGRQPHRSGGPQALGTDLVNASLTTFADLITSLQDTSVLPAGRSLYVIPGGQVSEFRIPDPLEGRAGFTAFSLESVPPLEAVALAPSLLVDLSRIALAELGGRMFEKVDGCLRENLRTLGSFAFAGGPSGVGDAIDFFAACTDDSRLRAWARRASLSSQVGLLLVERSVDMFMQDSVFIAAERAQGPGGASADGAASSAMFRGGAQRTGLYPDGAPTSAPTVVWEANLGAHEWATPAVAHGIVVVGTEQGEVVAMDARTGRERWRFVTGATGPVAPPAIAEGLVVTHASDGDLYAIDLVSGQERWRTDLGEGSRPGIASAAIAEGRAYVATWSPVEEDEFGWCCDTTGSLFAVDLLTGRIEWQYSGKQGSLGGATVGRDTVYFTNDDWAIHAVDRATGSGRWLFTDFEDLLYELFTTPALAGDTVVFGAWLVPNIYALDATTGRVRWQQTLRDGMLSSAAIADGSVHVGTVGGDVYALDLLTGRERWRFRADGPLNSSPAVSGDIVLIGSDQGTLYALDRRTGAERWRHSARGAIKASPVVSQDGYVYIVDGSGRLTALR